MSCVEGAVPVVNPEPNQYWEHIKSKDRAYFIGRDPDGRMVWQCEGDCIDVGNLDWSGWQHLPYCTGWDWEPDQAEEFPQYWTTLATPSSTIAYIKRIDQSTLVSVCKDGTEVPDSGIDWETDRRTRLTEQEALALLDKPAETWPKCYMHRNEHHDPALNWYVRAENHLDTPDVYLPDGSIVKCHANWDDIDSSLNCGVWLEVTEDEARARIGFVPVATEMDWVVQDRVPARNDIDEWCWCKPGKLPTKWCSGFGGWTGTYSHGSAMYDEVLQLRCRRKDLPPVPAPAEETFPQWYILKESEIRSWVPRWAIKRTGEETCIRYVIDGVEVLQSREPWTGGCEAWECCTATEAYDRLGTGILPPVPSEPRRVPVKLWVTYRLNDEGGDWPVRATQADQTCQNWKEIKFDGNGAFIEVEQ